MDDPRYEIKLNMILEKQQRKTAQYIGEGSTFLLLILFGVFFKGMTVGVIILVLGLLSWLTTSRLVRATFLSIKQREFVEAARGVGARDRRIIFRHILPNSITPLIVQVSLDVGGVILTVSALSFLGLGAQDPTPDWGLMVAEGQDYFLTSWWVVTFPGIAILVTAFAFTLLGDGLRDLMDPKRIFLR